ncbi:hypothetical protein CK623_04425 [Vandammella animalimorsus]|uniref:Uncharacterized protein n=1 Tax=Vandammella animalimorsus TaxID=2029117 RepID=A0A2A2ASC1_9BURK|nr:hypothetical protein CK623_04425 [Vandammella animalimorsus]
MGALDRAAVDALFSAFRSDDQLALSDEALMDALTGKQPLRPRQLEALLASPMTLRRMQWLHEHAAQAPRQPSAAVGRQAARATDAANDAQWHSSRGLMRAADSGAMAAERTSDGWWTLDFLRKTDGSWRALLKLDPQAPFAAGLLPDEQADGPCIYVLTGQGTTLFSGTLDLDGQLRADWPLPPQAMPPWQWLREAGGFEVTLV